MVGTLKIAIIGSRTFNDYGLLKDTIFNYPVKLENIKYLVSGGAMGADSLAQKFAKDYGLPILIFYPDWNIGKHAGFLRNERIIKCSNLVFAFQENESKGTQHSINLAEKYNRTIHIVRL